MMEQTQQADKERGVQNFNKEGRPGKQDPSEANHSRADNHNGVKRSKTVNVKTQEKKNGTKQQNQTIFN